MLQIGRLTQNIVWQLILVSCATGQQRQGTVTSCKPFGQMLDWVYGGSVPGLLSMTTKVSERPSTASQLAGQRTRVAPELDAPA